MKCIAILKDVITNIFAMWVFFIYGGISLAGTVILIGSIPGWDVFSVVISLLYLLYLGVVLLRLIISNIPSVKSRLEKKDTWAVFIARHYYMVSLWFAWGFILLCVFIISSKLDLRSLKAIGVIWGGGSAVLLGWLILETVWPMGVWAVKGLGKDSKASGVDPHGEKPWPTGTWYAEGLKMFSNNSEVEPPALPDFLDDYESMADEDEFPIELRSPFLFINNGSVHLPDLDRLVGVESLRDYFLNTFLENEIGGLMFTGYAGSGKTTHAGVFAQLFKTVNADVDIMGFRAPFDWLTIFEYLRSMFQDFQGSALMYPIQFEDNMIHRLRILLLIAIEMNPLVIILDNLECLEDPELMSNGEYDGKSLEFIRMVCELPSPTRVLMTGTPALAESLNRGLSERPVTVCPVKKPSYDDLMKMTDRLNLSHSLTEEGKRNLYDTVGENYRTWSWAVKHSTDGPEMAEPLLLFLTTLEVPSGTSDEQRADVLKSLLQSNMFKEIWKKLSSDLKQLFQTLCLFRIPVKHEGMQSFEGPIGRNSTLDVNLDFLADWSLLEIIYSSDRDRVMYEVPTGVKSLAVKSGIMNDIPSETLMEAHKHISNYHNGMNVLFPIHLIHVMESIWHYRNAGCHDEADVLTQYVILIYYNNKYYADALGMARDIAERKDPAPPLWSLQKLALCQRFLGRYVDALATFKKVADMSEDDMDKCEALNEISKIYYALENHIRAIDYSRESLAIARKAGEKGCEAWSLSNMGRIYHSLEDYKAALRYHRESLDIMTEIDRTIGIASCLEEMGHAYHDLGEYDNAIDSLEQSRKVYRDLEYREGEVNVLRALGHTHNARNDYHKVLETLKMALEIQKGTGNGLDEIPVLKDMTALAMVHGDSETAVTCLTENLRIKRELGDGTDEGSILFQLGVHYLTQNDHEKALAFFTESHESYQKSGDTKEAAKVLIYISMVQKAQGNMDAPQQNMNTIMKALKENADQIDESKTLNRLSKDAFEQGDLETALKHASASLAMAEETGDEDGKAIILTNISQVHMALGQMETALACLEKSLVLAQSTGNKTCEGKALDIMGNIYKDREEYDLALSYFEQALSIEKAISDKDGEGDTLNSIALIFLLRNDGDTAKYFLDQSIAIRRDLEDKIGEAANLINLSRCHELKGDFDTAEECLDQSLALNQETGNKVAMIAVYHNMAHAALDQGEYGKALTLWEKTLDLAVATQHAQGIFHVASTLGRVLAKSGHIREAGIVLKLASETGHAAGFPEATAIDELLSAVYQHQRDTLDLNDFLAFVPAMKSEKDLVTAGLWLQPVRVKKPLPQYENIILDRTKGLIGWMHPVSADIFDMTIELPVMFDKVDGDVVSVGIPIGELELIK
ncbi:MAG: tetratricopeptide repeat protein [Desulfobacteraceae bacterium]|jgi:tetratricopeptide (TPR) repeat protein